MRKREKRLIIAFYTTHDAMAFEEYCQKHGIDGRLIPLPQEINAGCGLAWSAPLDLDSKLHCYLLDARIYPQHIKEMIVWTNPSLCENTVDKEVVQRTVSWVGRNGGMTTKANLTKLASCAGCGAKVGAGALSSLLEGFETHVDKNLIVGFDKSDDASVYMINDDTALIQTVDFFPPIVDDPFLFGQIAAANAISDIYAMGGEPRLALNLLCTTKEMQGEWIREILRGGYEKVYEAGAIITGGHTIIGSEPFYGLSVSGFAKPDKILKNSNAKPGDSILLTKPLGIGILTTAAKAGMIKSALMEKITKQMAQLNKEACRIMQHYRVHSCTDITGFGLIGHSFEMAKGSNCTLHLLAKKIPFHNEALEMADMGFVPVGAYRNREYAQAEVEFRGDISRAMQDIMYDPQTSGGLLIAVDERDGKDLLSHLQSLIPVAELVGYVTEKENKSLVVEA